MCSYSLREEIWLLFTHGVNTQNNSLKRAGQVKIQLLKFFPVQVDLNFAFIGNIFHKRLLVISFVSPKFIVERKATVCL